MKQWLSRSWGQAGRRAKPSSIPGTLNPLDNTGHNFKVSTASSQEAQVFSTPFLCPHLPSYPNAPSSRHNRPPREAFQVTLTRWVHPVSSAPKPLVGAPTGPSTSSHLRAAIHQQLAPGHGPTPTRGPPRLNSGDLLKSKRVGMRQVHTISNTKAAHGEQVSGMQIKDTVGLQPTHPPPPTPHPAPQSWGKAAVGRE